MFQRRFIPFLIGLVFLRFFSFYFGYRAYQNHAEFKQFMSDAKVFQWDLDKEASLLSGGY